MKVEGACHCGEISFEAMIDPEAVRMCHCTDCQTLTGSAFRVTVQVQAEGFKLRTGQPTVYIKIAANGNKRAQGFCPRCGTPIYSAAPHDPKTYGIRVGTLKQRALLSPKQQIWYRSALPWVVDGRAIAHTDQQ
ncbi:MAG: GFA family protein [Steroidobacteraceae bacterium]